MPTRLLALTIAGLASGGCWEAVLLGAESTRPPDAAALRTTYDFIANRAHGLEYQGGRLVIDAGGPGFYKHIDGGWKTSWITGATDQGRPAALVAGLSGLLFLPIDSEPGAAGGDHLLSLTLRGRVPKQRLSVFVNEKPAGTIEVSTTWADYPVPVSASLLHPGENRIRLTFRAAGPAGGGKRSAASLARLAFGPAAESAPLAEASALAPSEQNLGGSTRRAFSLAGPGRLSFYLQVPEGGRLAVAYGAPADGAAIAVRVVRDGAAPRTLFEGPAPPGRFTAASWDLSAEGGQAVRVDLVGKAGATVWAQPRLAIAAAAPAALPEHHFRTVFLYMVDTLRADKVRVYNPKTRVQTPHFDAFAAEATRFAWNQVPGTWSLPSHASILTGVYPSVHKATAHEARLDPKVPFLAELLRKAGYRTALFSSNGYVSEKWGFNRGWDEIRNFIRENLPNGADYIWKTAKKWMDVPANQHEPQFVYLATVEPHVIYNPKKEFLARYWTKPYKGPIRPNITGVQLGYIKTGKLKVDDTDKAYLEALHDGEITQADSLFGAFIADLKTRGLYDSAAIIVVSDHGDEFWDHGDVGHAQGVYQELVHVPLMIRAPGLLPAGKVIQADVEAMDLFPTLLEMAGAAVPPGTQGSSLLPVVQDEAGNSPRAAFSQNLNQTRGLKVARYRFIHAGPDRVELYDEIEDPREQKNLAASHPVALRALRNVFGLLYAFENRWKKRGWGTAANLEEAFYREIQSR